MGNNFTASADEQNINERLGKLEEQRLRTRAIEFTLEFFKSHEFANTIPLTQKQEKFFDMVDDFREYIETGVLPIYLEDK